MTLSDRNPVRTFREVEAEAKKWVESNPWPHDRCGFVYIQHSDWSTFVLDSAFCFKVDIYDEDGTADWLVVFAEHHGIQVFAMSDLVVYRYFPKHEGAPKAPWQH